MVTDHQWSTLKEIIWEEEQAKLFPQVTSLEDLEMRENYTTGNLGTTENYDTTDPGTSED